MSRKIFNLSCGSLNMNNYRCRKNCPLIVIAVLCSLFLSNCLVRASEHSQTFQDSTNANSKHNTPFLRKATPFIIAFSAGGALFSVDKDIQRESLRSSLRGTDADRFFHTVEHFGTQGPYLITIALQSAYGLIFKDRRSFIDAGELVFGFVVTEGITLGVKDAVGRKRPYESDSPYKFFKGGQSFYSGHTVTAFTYATIMAKSYPHQDLSFIGINHEVPLIPIFMYSAAGLVGIQRIYKNVHWASDSYFGALAGYGFGSLAIYAGKRFEKNGFHLTYHKGLMFEYCMDF